MRREEEKNADADRLPDHRRGRVSDPTGDRSENEKGADQIGHDGRQPDNQCKYRVITLCGSTRFKEEFLEAQKRLTLEGNIVISVGLFGHFGDNEVWSKSSTRIVYFANNEKRCWEIQ